MEPQKDIPTNDGPPIEPALVADETPVLSEPANQVTTGPEPKKHTKLIVIAMVLLALLALASAAALVINKPKDDASSTTPATSEAQPKVEVAITETGFSPSTLIVKSGTIVTWRNTTETPRQIGSNPYPDHTQLPDFYSTEPIAPGGIYTYTFSKVGEWGYADYSKPTVGGTIVVQ